MSLSDERIIPILAASLKPSRDYVETVPMHPQDFEAHLAWVLAKRLHELVLEEPFPEKTVYYRIIG